MENVEVRFASLGGRLRRVGLAYLSACFAAACAISLALFPLFGPFALVVLVFAVPAAAVVALAPAALFVMCAERAGWRSKRAYAFGGALIGVLAGGLVMLGQGELTIGVRIVELLGFAGAGAIAGSVYHREAGVS